MTPSNPMKANKIRTILVYLSPVLIVLAVLFLTVQVASRRQPPARAEIAERALRVSVQTVELLDAPVSIDGFGQARARDEVVISPQVPGRVISVHPNLEVGGVIPAGEVMFAVDPRDYETRLVEAEATVKQWEAALARIQTQFETDKARLENYRRIMELAKKDFDRAVQLYSKDNIESESFAGNKEATYKQATDAYDLLRQTIDLYPLRLEEAQSSLTSSMAARDQAQLNLERATVRAPFDARVKTMNVEAEQWVTPGTQALTIADDSVLQISVALNSSEARKWLMFEDRAAQDRAWFSDVKRVPVEIAWTEALEDNQWQGTLDRVERFDEETRTITVVVRVEGSDASAPQAGRLPLVEGMFCRVRIPGQVAKDVVRLAAEIVGFDQEATGMQTVYVAEKEPDSGRTTLKTRKVRASHNDGDYVYIAEGLTAGEMVITTRLVNPLENTLLDVSEDALDEAPEKTAETAPAPAGR